MLAQVLLDASWLTIPTPEGEGCEGDEVIERVATAIPEVTLLPVWAVIVEAVRATGERRKRQAA